MLFLDCLQLKISLMPKWLILGCHILISSTNKGVNTRKEKKIKLDGQARRRWANAKIGTELLSSLVGVRRRPLYF